MEELYIYFLTMETVPLATFYEFCCRSLKNKAVVVIFTWKLWCSFLSPGRLPNATSASLRIGLHFLPLSCQVVITCPSLYMKHIHGSRRSLFPKLPAQRSKILKYILDFFFFKKFKQWQDLFVLPGRRKSVEF